MCISIGTRSRCLCAPLSRSCLSFIHLHGNARRGGRVPGPAVGLLLALSTLSWLGLQRWGGRPNDGRRLMGEYVIQGAIVQGERRR